jgi:hypothetical protein
MRLTSKLAFVAYPDKVGSAKCEVVGAGVDKEKKICPDGWSGQNILCSLRELVFFDFVRVDLFGIEIEPLYFYQIFFKVLEHFHDFSVNFAADALALFKQSPHFSSVI